jgi:hypothetical protein
MTGSSITRNHASTGGRGLSGSLAHPADREVYGGVEDPRALRVIHPKEEDVTPSAMREVHSDGCSFVEDWESQTSGEKLGAKAQRIVVCVAGTKHPLVTAHAPHALAHLVGERLEAERMVAGGKRA